MIYNTKLDAAIWHRFITTKRLAEESKKIAGKRRFFRLWVMWTRTGLYLQKYDIKSGAKMLEDIILEILRAHFQTRKSSKN